MPPEAQQTKAPDNAAGQQPGMVFSYNDVVGAMQRMLSETHAYLSQPVPLIDPRVVLDMLERCARFNSHLPLPPDDERPGAPN